MAEGEVIKMRNEEYDLQEKLRSRGDENKFAAVTFGGALSRPSEDSFRDFDRWLHAADVKALTFRERSLAAGNFRLRLSTVC